MEEPRRAEVESAGAAARAAPILAIFGERKGLIRYYTLYMALRIPARFMQTGLLEFLLLSRDRDMGTWGGAEGHYGVPEGTE